MPKKLTQKEYEDKIKNINPNIIVLGGYVNNNTKILHKCIRDGCGYEWETAPKYILYRGTDCPKCSYKMRKEKAAYTQHDYIKKLNSVNNNIKVIGEYINNHTQIAHMCKKCGYGSNGEWLTMPSHLLDGHGCPVCSGNIIGSAPEYKNSIFSQYEYKKFFQKYISEEQMKTNMPNSHAKIPMRCPECGRIKNISPNQLWRQGLGCICSDGVSYPNKFMFSFLEQAKIDFDREQSFDWSNGKIYDFYITSLNCIIECHGVQHYNGWNNDDDSLKKEKANDNYKKQLAIDNGVKYNNYIIIDCSKSNANYIKKNIILSGLLDILNCDINNIDLNKCNEFATSNMIKMACDLWNSGYAVKDIKEILKTTRETATKYLKIGKEIGWCDGYTNKESRTRSSSRGIPNLKNATPVYCKELNKVFESQKIASEYTNVTDVTIGACCRGMLKTAGGMHWHYLYDRTMRNGTIISGAISLGLISEKQKAS